MDQDTFNKLFSEANRIKSPIGVKVGEKLALNTWSQTLYWVTVSKVTPKQIVVNSPDTNGYKTRVQTFRMREYYKGSGEKLEAYGEGSQGTLYRVVTPAHTEAVDASYAERAQAAAQERADRDARDQERRDRIARDRANALAANPNVVFNQIGALGNATYYAANIVNEEGHMCFVVVGAYRQVDIYDRDSETREQNMTLKWYATINYSEFRSSNNSLGSMASCSPDLGACNTIDELFQAAIARVW